MSTAPQHRPVTLARRGMVAAPHYLAAEAGLDIIKAGGNAIDAAIAASAMLQVVYPFVCGLGGDVFMIIYDAASQKLYGLNGSGRAPRAAAIDHYHALGYSTMPVRGIHSITVPGCADGWESAARRFGRLGLARSLEPAIGYAEEGFAVGPGLHRALSIMGSLPDTHRSWHQHFLPEGVVPPVGAIMRVPTLARTLKALAEEGAETFYRGAIAEQIADFFSREGGLISKDDLAAHHSDWVEPLGMQFGDWEIYELPPNTQGVTALQMFGLVDKLALGETPLSAATVHLEVEAKKLAFADRATYLTDPEAMTVDPAALIDPAYLATRRALIDPAHATASVAPGGFTGDTIYLCAADGQGNVVSLIQSNYMGFGSGVVVDDTGIVLQNRGAYFVLDPTHANALAPSKRTLHTLIPSLAMRDGKPIMVFGTMGGDGQAQTHLQVYTAVVKYGLNIQQAIEQPRWVHGADKEGGERIQIEDRAPVATVESLSAMGHTVATTNGWDAMMGYAQGITFDQTTGVMAGGSDPRAEGIAAGW